jgi:hypothetical protein
MRSRSLLLACLAGVYVLACGGNDSTPAGVKPTGVPRSWEIINGAPSGPAGSIIQAPSIRVLDENAFPVPNVPVALQVVTGGGTLIAPPDRTDATGIVVVGQWRLGPLVGPQTFSATIAGLPVIQVVGIATAP